MKRASVLMAAWILFGGCGLGEPAATEISVSPVTKTVRVRSTKDETVTLNNMKASGSSTTQPWTLEVDGLALNSNASAVNPTIVPIIDANARSAIGQIEAHGANIIGGIDAVGRIVTTLAPVASAYVEGNTSVGLAKQQTKQMQAEMIGLVAGGFLNPSQTQSMLARLPSEVRTGVLDDPVVKAKLAQMQAEIDALKEPATQPTE